MSAAAEESAARMLALEHEEERAQCGRPPGAPRPLESDVEPLIEGRPQLALDVRPGEVEGHVGPRVEQRTPPEHRSTNRSIRHDGLPQ